MRILLRVTASISALLLLLPQVAAASDSESFRRVPKPVGLVSREDVIAGRASRAEVEALFRATTGRVATVESEAAQASGLPEGAEGGYTDPMFSLDLDGDGGHEVIARQATAGGAEKIIAFDQGGLLWRGTSQNSFIDGFVAEDYIAGGGNELLVIEMLWDDDIEAALTLYDSEGLVWAKPLASSWFELADPVEADSDAGSEIAISVWDGSHMGLQVLDGDTGDVIAEPSSSLDQVLGDVDESFVTDGPAGESDRAVLLSRVLLGYYIEIVDLGDGSVIDSSLEPLSSSVNLFHGADYTGDGLRDGLAYISGDSEWGVFDPSTLSVTWSVPEPDGVQFATPFDGSDVDADGGRDLCFQAHDPVLDTETQSAGIVCFSGADGSTLWAVTDSLEGEYTSGFSVPMPDIDGDGLDDFGLLLTAWECVEDDHGTFCHVLSYKDKVLSGRDGTALLQAGGELLYWLYANADLDGVPGADRFIEGWREAPDEPYIPPQANFMIDNGLTSERSWTGIVAMDGLPGYAVDAYGADLDGDGLGDVIVSAVGVEGECTPDDCSDIVDHAFVGAFSTGGQLLWSYEI